MYPNPQDVLPLPPHPSVEQYRNRAKDLALLVAAGSVVKPELIDRVRGDPKVVAALTGS